MQSQTEVRRTNDPLLILFPSLKARLSDSGKIIVTKKFVEGVQLYQTLWPGSVKVYMEKALSPDDNLDHITINEDANIDCDIIDFDNIKNILASHIHDTIVLSAADYRQNPIPATCSDLNIPCVITTEYTLHTRLQIAKATRKNLVKRWRGYWWEYFQEKKNIQAIRSATGLQANGLPTYLAYKDISQNTLLYFDTRVQQDQIISREDLDRRTAILSKNRPLRLLFSGRLNPMKGADHLIHFAATLKHIGIDFHLTICGDGELKTQMAKLITQKGLSQNISMTGTLDFHAELLPLIKNNIDLFICCHQQGDPSCTYLETMSCGVPIIGYANEAWQGLCEYSKTGWTVPMGDYKQLASKVSILDSNRPELISQAIKAREFALQHTFESTFSNRINQLQSLLQEHKKTIIFTAEK